MGLRHGAAGAAGRLASALARAWALRGPLVALHAGFVLLGAAILSPLAGLAVRAALRLSGEPVLSDWDIARFLLTPVGLAAGTLALATVAVLATLEVAAIMAADLAARRGSPGEAGWRAAAFVLVRAPRLVLFAALLILRLLLLATPFAIAGWLLVRPLLATYDLYFLVTAPPPAARRIGWVLGLLALAFAVLLAERLIAWLVAPAAILFGGVRPRHAFAASALRMRGRRAETALALVAGGCLFLVAVAAAAALWGGALGAVLRIAGPGLGAITVVLSVALAVSAVGGFVAAAGLAGTLAAFIVGTWLEGAPAGARDGPSPGSAPPAPVRWRRRAALLALVAIGAGAVTGGAALLDAAARPDAVEVIAHRGAAGSRPENTRAAFEQAIAEGATWIELDVQETADGAVVVIHDRDLKRVAGVPLAVHEATRADLAGLDVGSWFGPDWAGERVPTLEEVLALARGRIRLLIELKDYGHGVRLEERVVAAVDSAGMADAVAIMSFDRAAIARVKSLGPGLRVGLLAASAVGDLTRTGADFLALRAAIATPGLVARARAAGLPVLVWTINDPLSMSAAISRGVSGIITSWPGRAREVLAERAGMGTAERLLLVAADLAGLPRPAAPRPGPAPEESP
jgi:glycerophosphoryl diester phosphodiesterase